MPLGLCEPADVQDVLQKPDAEFGGTDGALATQFVESAIGSATRWFLNHTNGYWYDSTAGSGLIPSTPASTSNVRLDVPSSPHRQDRQIFVEEIGARYPVTNAGPFAKIQLPHLYVGEVTRFGVRQNGGGFEDWVADASIDEGRDGDYYVERAGQQSYGKSHLFVRADSIGARVDWGGGLLSLDYTFGLDEDEAGESWDDVRRGIAAIAAADLITDDDVLAQVPDNGQLVGVDTQADRYLKIALGRRGALSPYINAPVA